MPSLLQAETLGSYVASFDGFLTSMHSQAFPLWQAGFGAGAPHAIQPVIQPLGPWSAISTACPPPTLAPETTDASAPVSGGLQLFLTLPASCLEGVRGSRLLTALVPNARVLGALS